MSRLFSLIGRRVVLLGATLATAAGFGCTTQVDQVVNDNWITIPNGSRDLDGPSKLAPGLQQLVGGGGARDISAPPPPAPSPMEVGYPMPGTTDVYEVAIDVTPEVDTKALTTAGASILMRLGNVIYAAVASRDLPQVADVAGVLRINPMSAGNIPKPPKGPAPSSPGDAARDLSSTNGDDKFDRQGLTGKGVIVGVIDTGIDWRHQDFANADGSSRIIAIWDVFDDSWATSNGTIGSKPPFDFDGKPLGTLYTNAQINAALHGQMKIARTDPVGHGTACAGTAAGNGLATGNGVPAGTYPGIAPEADIIVVNTHVDDPDHPGNDGAHSELGAAWIVQVAAQRHEPCVINLSFGGHFSPHDGSDEQELALDQVVKNGQAPGVVICASASNDGEDIIHARGHFGPWRNGQLYNEGSIGLSVTKETELLAILDSHDDWQLVVTGQDQYLIGADKKPGKLRLTKNGHGGVVGQTANVAIPADATTIKFDQELSMPDGKDLVVVTLPPGQYRVGAKGNSAQVPHGVFDLYLPDGGALFGQGGDHKMVVGSPGTASSLITVGSYDFRNTWTNADSVMNDSLELGQLSDYSSAGFRADGVVKPDIAAPGQWTISSVAVGSEMSKEGDGMYITSDGKHLAWAGTSASCPYTCGVIALMLEKNSTLTEDQVKKIIRDTARHDDATGAVPNIEWGYGKLNPPGALAAVTAVARPVAPITPTPPELNPAVPSIPGGGFVGIYGGDGMTVELIYNDDGTFSGTIQGSGAKCPLTARLAGGRLEGTFNLQSQDFQFTATINGDQLTLTTGNKTHVLKRQGAPWSIDADWFHRSSDAAAADQTGQARDLDQGLTFYPKAILDPMINNEPAVTLLVPDGWDMQGQIVWNNDPWTMVSTAALVRAPGGYPAILTYPLGSYVDGIRQQRMQMFAPVGGSDFMAQQYAEGNYYLGKEIRLVVGPADYIRRFLIPLSRADLAQAQLVSIDDAPAFAKMVSDRNELGGIAGVDIKAVKARFRYQSKGRTVDEDMYCVVTAIPIGNGIVAWTAGSVSFAAEEGTMDQNMPLLACIYESFEPQLKWYNACIQVSKMMQENILKEIENQGALSRYISKVNDQIEDTIRQAYEHRSEVEDRCFKEFDDYIRGVGQYTTPTGGHVQLPTNHIWFVDPNGGYHAVNNSGQYVPPAWQKLQGG